jgi:hypothetical protein
LWLRVNKHKIESAGLFTVAALGGGSTLTSGEKNREDRF